jgi:hypothetical protein
MEMFTFCYPTMAVSTIYCSWSSYMRKRERALTEEVAFRLRVLARGLPELPGLFRAKGAQREAAVLGCFILALAMVLGPKFVGTFKPRISKTGSAEPAQQPLKSVMFRGVG